MAALDVGRIFGEVLSAPSQDLAYDVCPPELKDKLNLLIDYISSNSYYQLLWKSSELGKLGKEVKVLHPLTSWLIFLEPQNIDKVRSIMNDLSFILLRGHFIGGQIETFDRRKFDVLNHLENFAIQANVNIEELRSFALRNEWENFMKRLIV